MLPMYIQIIEMLKKLGHTVVSEHVASEVLEKIEEKITDEEIFNNDTGYIDECDCLVAEVTTPSIGVGYEIGYAISKGKLVLCIHREDANVSAMVRGNRRIISVPYMNIEDLDNTIELHLPNS